LASEMGVDAIGFVFADNSPRRVQPEEARAMRYALAPLVDAVALFMDNPVDVVREVIKQVRPTLLQFHGSEDDAFCRTFGVPYLKAIPMGGDAPLPDARVLHSRYPGAAGFMFDSHMPGEGGGSGHTFDWTRIPEAPTKPFVIAGGLHPDNVFDAIRATLPWGVDVSSGIESAPGIKDGDRMRRFVEEVRRADCHPESGAEPDCAT
ncbi:MAG: phosphoribosylanthranilate isomerase, partial [Pseudomonadota bacterium]|nr:phosphoribosylanthranilate isomerase [Pseudomonadota bacterium]